MPADASAADFLLDLASGDASIGGHAVLVQLQESYAVAHPPAKVDDDSAPAACDVAGPGLRGRRWQATWLKQVWILTRRNIAARTEGILDPLRVFQSLAVACIAGALWLSDGRGEVDNVKVSNISAVLFFQLLFNVFASLFAALFAFPTGESFFSLLSLPYSLQSAAQSA